MEFEEALIVGVVCFLFGWVLWGVDLFAKFAGWDEGDLD